MKVNIANPKTGQQKVITIEDEHKVMHFYEKRMGSQVDGAPLGDEFAGATLKITGGNDKQGFPMMQGVLKNARVRLLFADGMKCYRERRKGMRKRKSVRGCYVGHDIAIMNLVLENFKNEIPGLTDGTAVRRLGPKRAGKIRKLYGLDSKDDLKKYVVAREIKAAAEEGAEAKVKNTKRPKIQRLVTKVTLQRKRFRKSSMVKKVQQSRRDQKAYTERMHEYRVQEKEKRHAAVAKKRKGKKAPSA